MFDIGWSEMLVIGVVALIVVGPKDLPKMFHTLGEITGKARSMAREFQSAMNAAAKDAGVDGLARDIRKVTDVTSGKGLKKHVTDAVGFDKIEDEFKSIGGDGVKKRQGPKGPESTPESTPESVPFEAADFDDETDADEAAAAEHDAEHDAKMAREFSQVEAARLKRAEKAAKARQKAAHLRAQREADAEIQGRERPSGTGAPAARTTAPDQADSAPDSAPTSAPQTRDDQS